MNNHNPTPLRHRIIRPLLLLLLLFAFLPTMAQNDKLSVVKMYEDHDAKAQDTTEINTYRDLNGKAAALLTVKLNAQGATFDDDVCVIFNEAQTRQLNASEYRLWIADDSRFLKIIVPEYDALDVDFTNTKYGVGRVKSMKAYVLEINVPEKGVNYDTSETKTARIRISPANVKIKTFFWNGSFPSLENGETDIPIFKGAEYPYYVEADGYHRAEGRLKFKDVIKKDTLLEIKLEPIYGTLSVFTNPASADVFVDGNKIVRSGSDPFKVQEGQHVVTVKAQGYRDSTQTVLITENRPKELNFPLFKLKLFKFTSSPDGAKIFINDFKNSIGTTPFTKENYSSGVKYKVKATKDGYVPFEEDMFFNDSVIHINLKQELNGKNEFYIEGNVKAGSFMGFGATVGAYFMNINAEASYIIGSGKSEVIYWSGNNTTPIGCTYTPSTNISFKLGYGIPFSNRYRLTPQVGVNLLKLKETIEEGGGATPADGANTIMGLAGLRFSAAIAKNFGVSISPEYAFSMQKSKGYEALSGVSSDIKKWGEGFNVKLGLTVIF